MVQPGALPDLQSLQSDPTILQGQRSRTGPGLQEDWRIHGDVGDMTMMAMHSEDAVQEENQGTEPGERDPWQDSIDPWGGWAAITGAVHAHTSLEGGWPVCKGKSNGKNPGNFRIGTHWIPDIQVSHGGWAPITGKSHGKNPGWPVCKGKSNGKNPGQMHSLWEGYKAADPFKDWRKGGKPQASSNSKVQVECFASEQARGVVFSGSDWTDEESLKESCGLFAKDGTRAARIFLQDETFFQEGPIT
eukprot:s1104_g15.t1